MILSKLKSLAGALAFASTLELSLVDTAHAEETLAQRVGAHADELAPHQKADLASQYSMENGGRVGLFINIAPSTSLTPSQIGGGLVRKFAQDGIEADYVVSYADSGESSVTFYMNGLVWAGYSLGSIAKAYSDVVQVHRALRAEQLERDVPRSP